MKIFVIIFVLTLFNKSLSQGREDVTYPINIHYSHNGFFNVRINQAINYNYGIGSDSDKDFYIDMQSASLSFSILKNYRDNSELLYSINPVIWSLTTITNFLEPDRENKITFSIPFQITWFIFQVIPNTKFEPYFYKQLRLSVGLDTDYYISKYGLSISTSILVGPKYSIQNFDIGMFLNYQGLFFLSDEKEYTNTSLRIDFSYLFNKNKISKFIAHCRSIN
jgi:hypothetical protein